MSEKTQRPEEQIEPTDKEETEEMPSSESPETVTDSAEETKAESTSEEAAVETAESEEVDTTAEAAEDLQEKYMRLAAEYQNYRRRTEEEKQNIASYANERIAKEMLNVVDSFERALESEDTQEKSFKEGVELIYKQLLSVLQNFGVSPMETDGKPFDPNVHHAVLSEEQEGVEPGMILMEMQKGYMLNDRVLRPAMVKVSG